MTTNSYNAIAVLDAINARIAAENAAAFAAERPPNQDTLNQTARFLRGWAKSKPITMYDRTTSYYRCGSRMTKITPVTVTALLQAGLATGSPQSFTMTK